MMLFDSIDELKPQRKKINVNLTSLIDVLFLLLIFFMVSSTFIQHSALKVSLPNVKGDITVNKEKSLDVYVTKDQKIIIDGQEISLDDLKTHIEDWIKNQPKDQAKVHYKVDRDTSYGFALKIMTLIKSSGVKTIMAITKGDETGS